MGTPRWRMKNFKRRSGRKSPPSSGTIFSRRTSKEAISKPRNLRCTAQRFTSQSQRENHLLSFKKNRSRENPPLRDRNQPPSSSRHRLTQPRDRRPSPPNRI